MEDQARRRHWRLFGILLAAVLVLVVLNVIVRVKPRYKPAEVSRAAAEPAFSGSSDELQNSVVVPSLESPIPESTSAVWCATGALAWQKFEKEVARERLLIEGAEETSRALSDAPDPEQDGVM